jgi:hypothetical protein
MEFASDDQVTLQDLIDLTKGTDPKDVVIDTGFEVPDWTWLIIYYQKD